MISLFLVYFDRRRAQQCRQFAGGRPAREVHLEKTFLGVYKTQCARRVRHIACGNLHRSAFVAADADRGLQGRIEVGHCNITRQHGQAAAQREVGHNQYQHSQRQYDQQ